MASLHNYAFVPLLLLHLFTAIPHSLCFSGTESNQHSLVVGGSFAKLRLSRGLDVKSSPNSKFGTFRVCERVRICGLSRVRNLDKFAHALIVKVSDSGSYSREAEVCFHGNVSLGIGMCPDKKWETISNGTRARSMSPFDHKLLDVRTASSSLESFEVSIEEEFHPYRIIYLVAGLVLMSTASILSHSPVLYYGSSMAIGAILVILVVFFQGMKKAMKVIPTAPKTTLFIYSTIVGFLSFLVYHFHPFWRSILTDFGINEVFLYALGVFLLASFVLDGAWSGSWVVRKCVLTEEGSVNSRIAQLVSWSIQLLATLLILQSSTDHILAAEALAFGIAISSVRRQISRYLNRKSKKQAKRKMSRPSDSLAFDESLDEDYMLKTPNEVSKFTNRSQKFTCSNSSEQAYHDFTGTGSNQLYISSFHTTPQRRRLSKPEWENFTRVSTRKAVEDLISSPDFGRWASKNADRITVSPPGGPRAEQRRKWFFWF